MSREVDASADADVECAVGDSSKSEPRASSKRGVGAELTAVELMAASLVSSTIKIFTTISDHGSI